MRLMFFIAWKVYQKARSGKLPQCYTFQHRAGRIPPLRSACAQKRGNRTREKSPPHYHKTEKKTVIKRAKL